VAEGVHHAFPSQDAVRRDQFFEMLPQISHPVYLFATLLACNYLWPLLASMV
jgi:hypothetical protein